MNNTVKHIVISKQQINCWYSDMQTRSSSLVS